VFYSIGLRRTLGWMTAQDPAQPPDPSELPERPESEPMPEERRYTELFGLPAMLLVAALVAVVKGIIDQQLGFAIVGAVVSVGVLLAIGLAMTIARRG
jgi:hypothetical protein